MTRDTTHVFGMPFPPAAVPFWGTGTEEHTYQTPGPASELCSLRTMTSHRKPEDGWGHQSLQSGHSCSRQLCLTAPWPASRCHSKKKRFVGSFCVFPYKDPWGFSSPPLLQKKMHTLNSQELVCALCVTLCRNGWGRIPPYLWDALPCCSLQDHLYFSTHVCLQVLNSTAEP